MSSALSKFHLIGWDDVKCRPIYSTRPNRKVIPSISGSQLEEEEKVEKVEKVKHVNNVPKNKNDVEEPIGPSTDFHELLNSPQSHPVEEISSDHSTRNIPRCVSLSPVKTIYHQGRTGVSKASRVAKERDSKKQKRRGNRTGRKQCSLATLSNQSDVCDLGVKKTPESIIHSSPAANAIKEIDSMGEPLISDELESMQITNNAKRVKFKNDDTSFDNPTVNHIRCNITNNASAVQSNQQQENKDNSMRNDRDLSVNKSPGTIKNVSPAASAMKESDRIGEPLLSDELESMELTTSSGRVEWMNDETSVDNSIEKLISCNISKNPKIQTTFLANQQNKDANNGKRSYGSNDKKPFWIPNTLLCHTNNPAATVPETSPLIGWDDVKCRPIYFAPLKKKLQCRQNESEQLSGDGDCTDSVSQIDMIASNPNSNVGLNSIDNIENGELSKKSVLQKKRGYGSLCKKSGLITKALIHNVDVAFSSPFRMKSRRATFSFGDVLEKDSDDGDHDGLRSRNDRASSFPLTLRRTLSSRHKHLSTCTLQAIISESQNECDQNPAFDFKLDVDNNDESLSNKLEVGEAEKTRGRQPQAYHQPTSKTSLESARAFFQHLDSNHHLTILDQHEVDSQNNNIAPTKEFKTDVIRTTRRLVHPDRNPKLQAEYWKYCQTMLGAGVDPISIREFANNWSLHFSEKGVVCDGIFDC